MVRPLCIVGVLSFVLVSAGCPRPDGAIDFGLRGEITDPDALLKLIEEAEAMVATVNGESKVRVDTPDAKGAFTMFVAVSKPANIHLEPLDFFGRPQAVLVVTGDRFALYQAEGNRFYQGPASPQNVSRFLPIVLPAPELTQILLGAVPRVPHDRADLRSEPKCGCYVLTLGRGTITQILEVHPRSYRVLKSEVLGVPAYNLTFEDVGEYGAVSFPRNGTLKAPTAKVELDLKYTDVTLNDELDPDLFKLSPPEGAEVINVDQQGVPQDAGAPAPSTPKLAPDPAEGREGSTP